ncbi:dihydrolipoyl dehydrogenase [Martelella soudanensis]|uniref:dihydrolipoyl dehydrogenase n=1 Tax=unclassified Martelella TaxID=2629616 RepID=UPI0015DFD042|nr:MULTISPECIES: dihydrolipoyl dehydrogenase [unclassified Martelella]
MDEIKCRVLVIGAGPGGYVCAIRAGQLGLDTVIVDAGSVGGTCLNIGCVPSKALIHAGEEFARARSFGANNELGIAAGAPTIDLPSTIRWKDKIVSRLTSGVGGLLKKAKVRQFTGHARFVDGKTVDLTTENGIIRIRAEHVVIATGSQPISLPQLPFGGDTISSTQALSLQAVPEKLAVVGGGYIGLEIGTAYQKLGSRVTVIERGERILPQYDAALTKPVANRLAALGMEVLTGASAEGLTENGNALRVRIGTTMREIAADKILVTVGRNPLTQGWGLEELDLEMDGRFIRVDDRCRTSMREVYAIGDVTGEPMLAHRAMAQGTLVAEFISGARRRWNHVSVPAVCFTDPEIVTVGLSPEEAARQGTDVDVAIFPFSANARAMTMQDDSGFVRMACRKSDGLVVGIQAVGNGVSELSAAFGLALEMGAVAEDVAATIHAHPTLGEAFQEAALRVLGRALHV